MPQMKYVVGLFLAAFSLSLNAESEVSLEKLPEFIDRASQELNDQKAVAGLSYDIESYGTSPDTERAFYIGETLERASKDPKAAKIIEAVHKHYKQPNLRFSVSQKFLKWATQTSVDKTSKVKKTLNGVPVKGLARTKGTSWLSAVPSNKDIAFALQFQGNTKANTRGQAGRATIFSSSNTCFNSSLKMTLKDGELVIDPKSVKTNAKTSSCIQDVYVPRRAMTRLLGSRKPLVERFYALGANLKLPETEQAANEDAEKEYSQNLLEEARKQTKETGKDYKQRYAKVQEFIGKPEKTEILIDEKRLEMDVLYGHGQHLAAPKALKTPERHDLEVAMHESMFNNIYAKQLGGKKLTREQTVNFFKDIMGSIPEGLEYENEWVILYSEKRPLTVEFKDYQIKITIRGEEFSSGAGSVYRPLRIEATFNVVQAGKFLAFERVGDVNIFEMDGIDPLDPRNDTDADYLLITFRKLFSERIDIGEIGTSLGLGNEALEDVELKDYIVKKGWLFYGYQLNSMQR